MDNKSRNLTKSEAFDRMYRMPITFWGDVRIPRELKELAENNKSKTIIELGCGIGRFTRFMALQGLIATGIDFSNVAIAKAQQRSSRDGKKADYRVGDVTDLKIDDDSFDVSFDIGCFHCLDESEQKKYVSELHRILKPEGRHLLWVMDVAPPPNRIHLTTDLVQQVFSAGFKLVKVMASRRRIVKSHWFWFKRI